MVVTLLTDFGTQDVFVGVMKGVMLGIAPGVTLVDLTHHIPPQDIGAGAFALGAAHAYFSAGTVHLAVVDPGVGGDRRPVAAHIGEHLYVCPDNGLLTYVLARGTLHQAVVLDNARYHLPRVSRTFHGRDIFAPVAAHLASGVSLASLGTPVRDLATFPLSQPVVSGEHVTSHVVSIDVFGNVFLDVTEDMGIEIEDVAQAYSAVSEGSPVALYGSSGSLELAIRNGSAARHFGLRVGDTVTLRRKIPRPPGT